MKKKKKKRRNVDVIINKSEDGKAEWLLTGTWSGFLIRTSRRLVNKRIARIRASRLSFCVSSEISSERRNNEIERIIFAALDKLDPIRKFASLTFYSVKTARLTLHGRRHRPRLHARPAGELAQKCLQEVERLPDQDQDYDVGYQEGAASVLVGGERKPPHVPEPDRSGDAGHQELQSTAPFDRFRRRLTIGNLLLLIIARDLRR